MQLQPKQKMVLNMIKYGVVLGGSAGALSATVLIMTSPSFAFLSSSLPVMAVEIVSIAIWGLISGGIFGLISGVYSGIGMVVVTKFVFEDIYSHQIFTITMGAITALTTALFLYNGLWHLRLDGIDPSAWNATLMMAVILAVYASQRVVSQYLYEWSIRKQKAYS